MLIVCKTCACSYHIPREILGENGCRLRCVGCGEAWVITAGESVIDDPPIVEGQRMAIPPPSIAGRGVNDRFAANSGQATIDWREDADAPESRASSGLRRRARGAGATLAALAIGAAAMAVAAERTAIVRAVPNTARLFAAVGLPVNLRGVALDNVHMNIFDLGDKRVLVVEGAIVNLRDAAIETPNIRLALRGADKRVLYVWTTPAPKSRLGPDEQVAFRARLAAPPDGVSDVLVRFAAVGERLAPTKDRP